MGQAPVAHRMVWKLVAFLIFSQVTASYLMSTVSKLEKNQIPFKDAAQSFISELSNQSKCDLAAVERFSSYLITREYKFEPGADEVTYMNALSDYIASADENEILDARVELLYTTLLYSASGKESQKCSNGLKAANVTIKTFSSSSTKTRFLKLASEYISNDLAVFSIPYYTFKAEYLPYNMMREVAFKAYSDKLLSAVPSSGPFPLNHLYMFTLLCVRFDTPLPIVFFEQLPSLMMRSHDELKHVPLYFFAQSIHGYIETVLPEPLRIRATLAAMELLMTDIALETATKPEHIEKFSDFFAYAISKCPAEYHRSTKNIVRNAEKFQEIDALRSSINKIARVVALLRKSEFSIKLSCLEKLETFVADLAEKYSIIKKCIESVLNDLVSLHTLMEDITNDMQFELKLLIFIRSTLLQVRIPGLDGKNEAYGYGNIIFSLGVLIRLGNPQHEVSKQYLAMMTDEYIEMCIEKHMVMYTDIEDSISAKPSFSNNFIAFVKHHSNKDWSRRTIQRFFHQLIRCSRLVQLPQLSEPVYVTAFKHPEVDSRIFWALFLEFFSAFLENKPNAPTEKIHIMSFATFIASKNIASTTEKKLLSILISTLVKG